jgi:hypothetical protein
VFSRLSSGAKAKDIPEAAVPYISRQSCLVGEGVKIVLVGDN